MGEGIQISKRLLFQLVEDEKSKKVTKKTKPKESRTSQKTQSQKQIPKEPKTRKGPPSTEWPVQPPLFFPTPQLPTPSNPELESIRSVLKESETVLEKVQKHEENMVKEVAQRAKQLHDKEFKLPQKKTVICEIEKHACLSCYKEYVNDPLKCSTVVSSYQECVRRARKQVQVSKS